MLKSYLVIALRNLLRHPFQAGINIAGLAIGVMCSLLIVLIVEKDLLEPLKQLLGRFPGTVPVYLRLEFPEQSAVRLKLAEDFKVDPRQELIDELGHLLGDESVVIKRNAPSTPSSPYQRFRPLTVNT